jgi:hypothetical protein
MPDQFLRQDLPERETAGEDGAWILLPRSARPRYRHRRFTRVHAVPITRQVARAVPWSDGGTLEAYLLDRGAESWPVNAEVDLYEALPGTQLGHMAAGEGGQTAPQGFDAATELQPLSPEVAGLLLGEPGLGRGPARSPAGATPTAMRPAPARVRPAPGGRFYRVRPTGLGVRRPPRPRRRVAVWFDLTSGRPGLRIAIRLSERQAQQLLTRLDPATDGGKRDLPGALADLKAHYQTALPSTLMARLRRTKTASNAAQAGPTADRVTAAVTTALSGFLTERSHLLAAAARDPAHGVTLTLTFPGVTLQSLGSSLPAGTVDVSPGWARRG